MFVLTVVGAMIISVMNVTQEAGDSKAFEALLEDIEQAQLEGGALDKACQQLQQLVQGLSIPSQISKDVGEQPLA